MSRGKPYQMIPLRYREVLPPFWYEHEGAIYHFEAAKTMIDTEDQKTEEWSRQFLLPTATYGLDIWEWVYFGGVPGGGDGLWLVGWDKQERILFFDGQENFTGSSLFSGITKKTPVFETPSSTQKTLEERRAAIRRKRLSKARFTIPTLRSIGSQAGDLLQVTEHYDTKLIRFHYAGDKTVDVRRLTYDFERIRPVHVNGCVVALAERARYIVPVQHDVHMKIKMKVASPPSAAYFNGRFFSDGSLSWNCLFVRHYVRMKVTKSGALIDEEDDMANVMMTRAARIKMARAHAGEGTVSPIVAIGWGSGGHHPDTKTPVAPDETWTAVPNEFLRKPLEGKSFPVSTTLRMDAVLREAEGIGETVSVCGLYDADGDLVAVKTFTPKGKDGDVEIEVQWDEEF